MRYTVSNVISIERCWKSDEVAQIWWGDQITRLVQTIDSNILVCSHGRGCRGGDVGVWPEGAAVLPGWMWRCTIPYVDITVRECYQFRRWWFDPLHQNCALHIHDGGDFLRVSSPSFWWCPWVIWSRLGWKWCRGVNRTAIPPGDLCYVMCGG